MHVLGPPGWRTQRARRAATAVLDWCVFLWRSVRLLLVGFAVGFLGHLVYLAIAAGGHPTLAAVFLLLWTAALGVGIVLWFARQAREDARR